MSLYTDDDISYIYLQSYVKQKQLFYMLFVVYIPVKRKNIFSQNVVETELRRKYVYYLNTFSEICLLSQHIFGIMFVFLTHFRKSQLMDAKIMS